MKKTFLALMLLTFTLTGCSGNPVEKIDGYLQTNNFKDAMEWLADELEDEPESPLLHTLAVEVILNECAQTNCFDKNPKKLESLTRHFLKIKEPDTTYDDEVIHLHERLLKLAKKLIQSKHHPKALASINHFVPYGLLMQKFTLLTFKKASEHIIKGDIPPASTLMASLSKKIIRKDPNQAFATLLNGFILNDQDIIDKALNNFEKADNKIPLNDNAIKALPYAIYQQVIEKQPNEGTETFIKEFRNILKISNIPYLKTKRGQAKIANAVYAMSRDRSFIERAKQHSKLAQKTKNIDIKNKILNNINLTKQKEENFKKLELSFIKLALLTNPKNKKSWDIFLEPATLYAAESGDASILFEDLSPGDIPSSMIKKYNATLFDIAEKLISNNKSILEIIQHVILPAEGANFVKTKVTKLLNEAMISAVNKANYDLVYKYASFQPDIAKLSRQKVVSITIEALENKWRKNDFEGMDKLAEFLSKTMEIDFSLDSLLLQNFDDFLTQSGIEKELSADTGDALLEDRETAKINLGDKFNFLKRHFKEQPDIIDNLLKSLIVKSEGVYGIPVSLHKLYTYFSGKFSEKDKNIYLINAIKNSLTNDKELTAIEYAEQGQKIQKIFTDIPKTFIVNETMKRLKTLSDSKDLWLNSGAEFKEMLINTKPQFTTLMRAIEAYENGNHEKAASLFTILSNKKLIKQARPYLQEYVATVREQVGAYALNHQDRKENLHTKLLYIDLINDTGKTNDSSKTTSDSKVDLLAVKITLISQLGDIKVKSAADLSEDFGQVFRYEIIGRINPNTMEITIPEDQKSGQGLPLSFEKIFGDLRSLSLEGDRIIYDINSDAFTFNRISGYSTKKPNYPDGKFSITDAHKNNNVKSRHVLPVGSIIEFKTNKRRPIVPKGNKKATAIYPIKGMVYHPSADRPRPMDGFYDPSKQLLSFGYTYPLINGGTLDAVIRCQVVGSDMTCAGHNKHWGRQKYSYIVHGRKILVKQVIQKSKINR